MIPDYDKWPRDKLITRLIELEEHLIPSNANFIIGRFPESLGPVKTHILHALIDNWPKRTSVYSLMELSDSKSETSIKVLVSNLRKYVAPADCTIANHWGQGYILNTPAKLRTYAEG